MSRRAWLRGLALANFTAGLALVLWLSCSGGAQSPPPAAGAAAVDAATAPPATPEPPGSPEAAASPEPPALASLEEVRRCLDGGGGVQRDRCVTPATLRADDLGLSLNDEYFSASKAAVFVEPKRPAQKVYDRELAGCSRAPMSAAQNAAQNAAPRPAPAEVLACVLDALERRTTVP